MFDNELFPHDVCSGSVLCALCSEFWVSAKAGKIRIEQYSKGEQKENHLLCPFSARKSADQRLKGVSQANKSLH